MGRARLKLLVTAAFLVAASFAQPLMAQGRAGGMRVYEGRTAAAPRGSPRQGGMRVYERRPGRHAVDRPHDVGGRHRFHHGKSAALFWLPFGWFAFDPWMYAPYPPTQTMAPPQQPRRPSKVIEVSRGPAGVEVKVRYADDRQAIIPATDTVPPPQ